MPAPAQQARLARLLAAALALCIGLAWLVPPLLDWGRYRTAIASIAAARLGRGVTIGGQISLRLLPEAVLTAADVELPDQGDGISAHFGSLRLRVSLGKLLAGQLVARDLVLDGPILRLPWPLPESVAHPARPLVPRGFAARIEGGSLTIGQLTATGIAASIHGNAVTGSLGATGGATVAGLSWQFDSRLGAPGPLGVSPVELTVRGVDRLHDTGAHFRGQGSGDTWRGELDAAGGNLAQLIPGPGVSWKVHGAVAATSDRIEAAALALILGGVAAQGNATLTLVRPAHLDVHIATPSVNLVSWIGLLGQTSGAALPFALSLKAAQAPLHGGALSDLDMQISADGQVRLDHARARLPGGAQASLSGVISRTASGAIAVAGPGRLDAPNLRATLGWLRNLAPALVDMVPAGALSQASLAASVSLQPGGIGIDGLNGTVDGSQVTGRMGFASGTRPSMTADLHLGHLRFEDLRAMNPRNPGFDADVRLHAKNARIAETDLSDLTLDAQTGLDGTRLRRLETDIPGAHLSASGTLGAGGVLADGRVAATIGDAARFRLALPSAWQGWLPAWQGAADMELIASGPPQALALQLRADAGDLRLEAESLLDFGVSIAETTITLRHPGAPRLLTELGLAGAEAWLDTGSFALRAHLRTAPGHVLVHDFDLNAATLRLAGHATIDVSGPVTRVDARIAADTLALPAWATWRTTPIPSAWTRLVAGKLHLEAKDLLFGLRPSARNLSADINLEQGIVLADPVSAEIAGGPMIVQAAMALDGASRLALRGALTGAAIAGPLTGLPVDLLSGSVDADLAADATGASGAALASTLSGTLRASLHDGTVGGLDMSRLTRAFSAPLPLRGPELRAAITAGASTGLDGEIEAIIAGGSLQLQPAGFDVPSGTIGLSGSIAVDGTSSDLHLTATPGLPGAPPVTIAMTGPWGEAKRSDDLSEALAWGAETRAHPVRKPATKHRRAKPR